MSRTKSPRLTIGPSATYTEYNPNRDPRMRQAMERARRDQPALIPLVAQPELPRIVK